MTIFRVVINGKLFFFRPTSATTSYEDLSTGEALEMQHQAPMDDETSRGIDSQTNFDGTTGMARGTLGTSASSAGGASRRLVRQSSVMDTQRDSDGSIKMTYWF